jgi:type IX secretion system PorP/SprF family membrane protein
MFMKTRFLVLIAHLLLTALCVAQDYHFSQFDANSFYVNPALTGERLGEYTGVQMNATYRDQMSQFTKYPGSYRSIVAGIDEPINSKFSLGQVFYDDKSAKSALETFGFMLSCSHKIIDKSTDRKGNHNLSVGLQMGFFNTTLFPGNFTYDTQYSTSAVDGFDRGVWSGETFARQSYYKFNANFGIYYRVHSNNKKLTGFGGFSIYNIPRPSQSFYDNGINNSLPLRFNLHGGATYLLPKLTTLRAQVFYMNQARAHELNVSLLWFSKIEGSLWEPVYGVGTRNKDALIFQLGIKFKGLVVKASYDVSINYAKAYRNQGFEFSLVNTFRKKGDKTKVPENKVQVANPDSIQP